ncbi:MAG TPA: cobalamin-binding protein [Acidimicrobiia bacterium]|nr:cobalamin-binding protein [Acidimicrobiia bacterium]
MDPYPRRIVCLTEEPTEVLYSLGEQDRIAGISHFTVRPPQAREEKPRVSGFTSASSEKIMALDPDLVVGFSDIQADIARDLIKQGVEVWISNHRTIDGILGYIRRLGAMVGRAADAAAWADELADHVNEVRAAAQALPRRPRVYFEEWDDPMITGICWVSELIEAAGGEDIFAEKARSKLALDRIVEDPQEVVGRDPDLILASWCGKKLQPEKVWSRPGWGDLGPVRARTIHEIPPEIILQPGPAALTDGLDHLHRIIAEWAAV